MSGKSSFGESTISDGKRFVRGEHWLAVRNLLRRRDRVHHAKWVIATLAGGHPAEEIGCIRELMPKAFIIALDIDPQCCEAAMTAGANDAICVDIFAWQKTSPPSSRSCLPPQIIELGDVDALNLDLCGGITKDVEMAVNRYSYICRRGAFLLTFSYGRDVCEIYEPGEYRGVPEPVGGRVRLLTPRAVHQLNLTSVMTYKGNEMPMCAMMWSQWKGRDADLANRLDYDERERRKLKIEARPNPSFVKVGNDDLSVACAYPDVARLYGLPDERVQAFRRHFTALKAVATRRAKEQEQTEEFKLTIEP